jgi:outer membrane protein TolC
MSDVLVRAVRSGLRGVALALFPAITAAAPAEPPPVSAAPPAAALAATDPSEPDAGADDPFAGAATLERSALVREVMRRNPTLSASRAAWRAALARPAAERALPDPMLEVAVGPWSFGKTMYDDAYRAELRQPIPFPGKLRLRGEIAEAEAEAAGLDYEAARLRLAQLAAVAYEDWVFAARASAILASQLDLLAELQRVAAARYGAGLVSLEAPLQAESERAMLEHRSVEVDTEQRIAGERINALLQRSPELPLPSPPPASEPPPMAMADAEALAARALATRPELRAAAARAQARERGVDLARRELLPDFEVFGMYDGFWQENPLRGSVGVALNLPLNVARRRSAIEEARAELARAKSERARAETQIRLAVMSANERMREAHHLHALVRDRVVPAARDRAAAARSAFESGQESFLTVIDAERGVRAALLEQAEAEANLGRRHAELDRALGVLPDDVEPTPEGDAR